MKQRTKHLLAAALVCICCASGWAQNIPQAPCSDAAYHQFDFWIGEWEVFNPQGKLAGTNAIVAMDNACGLRESWSGGNGTYRGTSISFYDAAQDKWHQTWIDNQGKPLYLNGTRVGNQMILFSDTLKDAAGNDYLNRITWTLNDDKTVRQHWEVTKDEGATWQTVFDGLYKPKL